MNITISKVEPPNASIEMFCNNNDFVQLYRSYDWNRDCWETGFVDIFRLEIQLITHDGNNGITLDDVREVAKWGKLRNTGRICGETPVLPRKTFNTPDSTIENVSSGGYLTPLSKLSKTITSGIGPTYFTKILRFSAPTIYGALDTRCVRVFGKGDPECQRHDWLDITVKNYGYGCFIPEIQRNWPSGYEKWLDILNIICTILPANCPHPPAFVEKGLRQKGVWTCADVEMALFTYASRYIAESNGLKGQTT